MERVNSSNHFMVWNSSVVLIIGCISVIIIDLLYAGFKIKAFYKRTLLWKVRFLCAMSKRHNPIKR